MLLRHLDGVIGEDAWIVGELGQSDRFAVDEVDVLDLIRRDGVFLGAD